MADGIITELDELIALKRFARKKHCHLSEKTGNFGNYLTRLRGRGMDFAEVRNYQAGDEIRHMEWRMTARTGRPHIKLYQEERECPVVILSDFNPSMYFGTRLAFKSVVAARLAAIIAWVACKQGDRVGGLLFSTHEHSEFIPRSREAGILPWIARLSHYSKALYNQKVIDSRPLSDALLRLRRVTKPGSTVILISDFYQLDLESEQHLNHLRAHNDLIIYHVCDPLELAPPPANAYAITDGSKEAIIDTRNGAFKQNYQLYCDQRLAAINALGQRLQIHSFTVTAEMKLGELVWQTFPRRTYG